MPKEYHNIISLQEHNVPRHLCELLDEKDYEAVLAYLGQWDYGPEMEHSPTDSTPWGTFDKTWDKEAYDGWTYTIAFSHQALSVALYRWRENGNG